MKIDNTIISPINNSNVKTPASNVGSSDFENILEKAKETGDTEQLKEACSELESVFINMMMKSMRSTVTEDEGIFSKSEAEKMFEGMLDEEFSSKMSKAGGIGIGDMIFDQMSKYLYNEDEVEKPTSTFEMKG